MTPTEIKAAIEKIDQADAQQRLSTLTCECDQIEAALRQAGRTFPARPVKSDANDLLLCLEEIEVHHARVSVLAKVAGLKVAPAANVVAQAASKAWAEPVKAQTATERVLAIKGAKLAPAQPTYSGATARCIAAKSAK